jgi:hypothetical protein
VSWSYFGQFYQLLKSKDTFLGHAKRVKEPLAWNSLIRKVTTDFFSQINRWDRIGQFICWMIIIGEIKVLVYYGGNILVLTIGDVNSIPKTTYIVLY